MDNLTEEQKKRLAEAGQAAVNMSHGIKNILQSLRSGRDVMDQALGRHDIDVAVRTWKILKQNLERIQTLSLNMLKFSKDEGLHPKPCDFNRLVESVIKTVKPQADHRHIKIIAQFGEHLESVSVDFEKMQDVVMNLLINAIEAVADRSGQVAVRTRLDSGRQKIILSVSDNGPGIEDTSVIFEPFQSTKDNVGAGLGLTIATQVVEKHGGAIEVESSPGRGAAFTVSIPVQTN